MIKRMLAAGLLFLIVLPRFSAAAPQQQCTEIPIPCMSGSPHSACVITHCTPVAAPAPRPRQHAARPAHRSGRFAATRGSLKPKRAAPGNDCVNINTAPGVPGGVGCPVFPNRSSPNVIPRPETPEPQQVAVPQQQITPAPGPFSSLPTVPTSPPVSDSGPRQVPLEPFSWPKTQSPNSLQPPPPGPFTSMPLPPITDQAGVPPATAPVARLVNVLRAFQRSKHWESELACKAGEVDCRRERLARHMAEIDLLRNATTGYEPMPALRNLQYQQYIDWVISADQNHDCLAALDWPRQQLLNWFGVGARMDNEGIGPRCGFSFDQVRALDIWTKKYMGRTRPFITVSPIDHPKTKYETEPGKELSRRGATMPSWDDQIVQRAFRDYKEGQDVFDPPTMKLLTGGAFYPE